jgi:hypothetical protein
MEFSCPVSSRASANKEHSEARQKLHVFRERYINRRAVDYTVVVEAD